MDYSDRWQIIKPLGQGGQGKVFRVLDISEWRMAVDEVTPSFSAAPTDRIALNAVINFLRMDKPSSHGALKVLHEPSEARDASRAYDRIKLEIQAMSDILHPNLLKIIDADPDSKWYVSHYHTHGTLSDNQHQFTGDFAKALRAFWPLVEGVAELHKQGRVHRDIKPQNVFFDAAGNMILGDFGLVFFTDPQHTRISDTLENVGSTDWMPPWAMRMRIEDVKPSFDVFSLGKLLWFMVSGSPILRLWYFDEPEFDVEAKFPDSPFIKFANPLFKQCIVERERNCLLNASALLAEIDQILFRVDKNIDPFDIKTNRKYTVCGIGYYELIDINAARNLGITPYSDDAMKIFMCDFCGNIQLFAEGLPKQS